MDDVANAYSFNNHALLRLHETTQRRARSQRHSGAGQERHMAEAYEKDGAHDQNVPADRSAACRYPAVHLRRTSQADRGREVYQKWCTPCHGTGLGKPGTSAAAAHGVKPAVLEQRTDLTPKMIETAVRKGVYFMPRFRKTEISNADLAAIVAYLVHK